MPNELQQYRYPSEDIAAALRQADGNLKDAAGIVGCTQRTVLFRLYREPELAALCTSNITGSFFKYTIEEMTNAIRQAKGNISEACNIVECARDTMCSYIDRVPEIRAVYLEETERLKDLAVTRLYEAVDRGEPWAIALAIRQHASVFKLYGGTIGSVASGNGNGKPDLAELSDEHLNQLYTISQRLEGNKAGVIEAEVD